MTVNTRLFGEVTIDDDKIIKLEKGIVGFPDLKNFTLIYDNEKGEDERSIMWFQSLDEPQFAMPVLNPIDIVADYNPTVNDELLEPLGELTEDNLYVLVTVKVPKKIEDMTINLKAPIIINSENRQGGQIIVEDDVDVRFPIYDILKNQKGE
ncbi:MAG: flagellar assembly protein FliW [Lachnospiraceae bacterium]|nr:flagellar assembly protein FliW [Lachnospiraceae bacterium]